jgi:hypothetical protein
MTCRGTMKNPAAERDVFLMKFLLLDFFGIADLLFIVRA